MLRKTYGFPTVIKSVLNRSTKGDYNDLHKRG